MSKQTANNLFMVASMPRLYQHILSGIDSYEGLGRRILKQIKVAHAFRQVEQVKELARILRNIPIREYQLIAQYYLVWCKCREYEYPAITLDRIIEQTQTYKTKALFSRAAIEGVQGNIERAMSFYMEALKTSPTISEYVDLMRSIAALKSTEGFHAAALRDLQTLEPFIKYAEPRLYYDYLNSYAIELGEVGCIYEARNISQIVIHSPFAFAYPEWQDTANDLRGLNRSFVAFKPFKDIPRNVLPMPAREHEIEAQPESKPARVMSLQKWKQKMVKKKKDEPEVKDTKDMLWWIMNTYTDDGTNDHQRHKIYEAVKKVMAEKDKPEPDDDDTGGA